MTDRAVLLAIRETDPDGWDHTQPTSFDYARFKLDTIHYYGQDAWDDYHTEWNVTIF